MKKPSKQTANADPTKAFFVDMITRDITLEDCILDLIDNAVDQALSTGGGSRMGIFDGPDLTAFRVSIKLDEDSFSIKDNCGGMTEEAAAHTAFTFGRKPGARHSVAGVGVYGIGMKRALFKIARNAVVRSTFTDDIGERVAFQVTVDVKDWLSRDLFPWDFAIEESEPLASDGLAITADKLTRPASRAFSGSAFTENLRRIIGRDYMLHMLRGLTISVNGRPVTPNDVSLRSGGSIQPLRMTYEDSLDGQPVVVELSGGMAAPPPNDLEADESEEGDTRSGWYIACNGRIVLAADRTAMTGWGTQSFPVWHTQYAGFIGMVSFLADPALLPLTTTKRSVDTNSELYRRALPRMQEVTRAWIDYTNARRGDLAAAKKQEDGAASIPIQSVQVAPMSFPAFQKRKGPQLANVNYSVSVEKMRELTLAMGEPSMKYRDAGLRTFEYAYADFVGSK